MSNVIHRNRDYSVKVPIRYKNCMNQGAYADGYRDAVKGESERGYAEGSNI